MTVAIKKTTIYFFLHSNQLLQRGNSVVMTGVVGQKQISPSNNSSLDLVNQMIKLLTPENIFPSIEKPELGWLQLRGSRYIWIFNICKTNTKILVKPSQKIEKGVLYFLFILPQTVFSCNTAMTVREREVTLMAQSFPFTCDNKWCVLL